MTNSRLQSYCVNDKALFDLMYSSKRKLSDNLLRKLAAERGIFYSPALNRHELADRISTFTHDYHDMNNLLEQTNSSKRPEKTTAVVLDTTLSSDNIRDAFEAYSRENPGESINIIPKNSTTISVVVGYDEVDYSKTQLAQIQHTEDVIEIDLNRTDSTIRYPANDKIKQIVDDLQAKISSASGTTVSPKRVDLSVLRNAEDYTNFFMTLIARIPNFNLLTVTNMKVAAWRPEQDGLSGDSLEEGDDLEADDLDVSHETDELIAHINQVIMRGENLHTTETYRQLLNDGFYINSITWHSVQAVNPFDKVKFIAEFDKSTNGCCFKYDARVANFRNGKHAKSFKVPPDSQKKQLYILLERVASEILNELTSVPQTAQQEPSSDN